MSPFFPDTCSVSSTLGGIIAATLIFIALPLNALVEAPFSERFLLGGEATYGYSDCKRSK